MRITVYVLPLWQPLAEMFSGPGRVMLDTLAVRSGTTASTQLEILTN
jgi:hypothetical protein